MKSKEKRRADEDRRRAEGPHDPSRKALDGTEEDVVIIEETDASLSDPGVLEELEAHVGRSATTAGPRANQTSGERGSMEVADAETDDSARSSSDAGLVGRGPGELERLRAELAAARNEAKEARDRQLRALADYDNLRRRTERERLHEGTRALARVIEGMLPVIDNLSAALATPCEGEDAAENFRAGVELIGRQLVDAFGRLGVTEVPGVGSKFDPEHHDAVMREETTTLPHNTVAQVLRKGYRLGDRLLRPAMVKVAVAPEGSAAAREAPRNEESGEGSGEAAS